MKYRKIDAGYYRSLCGRVEIVREEHMVPLLGTKKKKKETHWAVTVDGYTLCDYGETKREAELMALQRLNKEAG